jgi:hypothetical protein
MDPLSDEELVSRYRAQTVPEPGLLSWRIQIFDLAIFDCPESLFQRSKISGDQAGAGRRTSPSRADRSLPESAGSVGAGEVGGHCEGTASELLDRSGIPGDDAALWRGPSAHGHFANPEPGQRERSQGVHRKRKAETGARGRTLEGSRSEDAPTSLSRGESHG